MPKIKNIEQAQEVYDSLSKPYQEIAQRYFENILLGNTGENVDLMESVEVKMIKESKR